MNYCLPLQWKITRNSNSKKTVNFSMRNLIKIDLSIFALLTVTSFLLYFVWELVLPEIEKPGSMQLLLWTLISLLIYQSILWHYQALGLGYYNLLASAYSFSLILTGSCFWLISNWNLNFEGEILYLANYCGFILFLLISRVR